MTGRSSGSLPLVRQSSPLLQIGKRGLSNNFLIELKEQVKKNRFVKIKILKNAPFENRKAAFEELKTKVDFIDLVEERGWNVIVTQKKG